MYEHQCEHCEEELLEDELEFTGDKVEILSWQCFDTHDCRARIEKQRDEAEARLAWIERFIKKGGTISRIERVERASGGPKEKFNFKISDEAGSIEGPNLWALVERARKES